MPDFENAKILNDLKELKNQLEIVNEKFEQIEQEMKFSKQSLQKFYEEHKARFNIDEKMRISENIFRQLTSLHEQFANIQNGASWLGMQIAVYMSTLQRTESFVQTEDKKIEAQKRREAMLLKENKLSHTPKGYNVNQVILDEAAEKRRLDELAEKARIYPFHLTPYYTRPY